jgi:pseudouridine-5'-phosphate glycosidase
MTTPYQPSPGPVERPRVNAQTLWTGGAATAVVAALVALVGVLLFRGVFDIAVLAPEGDGVWGDVSTAHLMIVAAAGALLATALGHILLLSTPRAATFFAWTTGLVVVAAAIAPFTTDADLDSQAATAVIYLAVGVATISLISGVIRSASRSTRWSDPR